MKTRPLEEVREEVEAMRSGEGTPVDERIKTLVIGLRCWNVETVNSCAGHLGRGQGLPYPWVDTAVKDAEKVVQLVRRGNMEKLQTLPIEKAKLWIIKPYAGFLRIMPEQAEHRKLEEMQQDAINFGQFLQELAKREVES